MIPARFSSLGTLNRDVPASVPLSVVLLLFSKSASFFSPLPLFPFSQQIVFSAQQYNID